MPQTDLYLCEDDVLEIARIFFARGAKIVPALDYSTPEVLEISTEKRLRDILLDSDLSLLFVVSPAWERSALVVRSVKKDAGEMFYISQKEGGPSLDIFYFQPRKVDGMLAIPHGFVSYHDRFWNPARGCMEPAPSSLVKAYQETISRLKAGGREIVRSRRKLFVTRNTLLSGLKLIDLKKHVNENATFVDLDEKG